MLRIKELREEAGLTQSELASRLNVSTSTVGMYEQNRRTPSTRVCRQLSEIFKVNIDYILGLSSERAIPKQRTSLKEVSFNDGRATIDKAIRQAEREKFSPHERLGKVTGMLHRLTVDCQHDVCDIIEILCQMDSSGIAVVKGFTESFASSSADNQ